MSLRGKGAWIEQTLSELDPSDDMELAQEQYFVNGKTLRIQTRFGIAFFQLKV